MSFESVQCLLPIRFGFTSHKSAMAASAVAHFLGVFGLLYLKDKLEAWHGLTCHSECSPAHSNVILKLKD
jgi:hypothetical protein